MSVSQDNPWQLYDELLVGIPDDELIQDFAVGLHWTYIETNKNLGVAMTIQSDFTAVTLPLNIKGKPLKEVAAYVKSWNFVEASLGLAAINCYYNKPEKTLEDQHAFDFHQEWLKGKNVCMIGHFHKIEETLMKVCNLTVLERRLQLGDYPDTACEYIIPEQDVLILTASTLVNKTCPRLLQLAKNCKVIMLGPSTPLTEKMKAFGVDYLSGFMIDDKESVKTCVKQGDLFPIFPHGRKINI